MVVRVVDTKFWSSMDVIDKYSVEDKFFALYLMTNERTTQSGIYSLPKKIMSFETGFTQEVIQVLLDRFCKKYKQIIYSEKSQELSLVKSLEYSILKGGRPVTDLLKRELRQIKDGDLILATYQSMKNFWEISSRNYDHTIQSIFEEELEKRKLLPSLNESDNELQNVNENYNANGNYNDNKNHNESHNDNEESSGTNRPTNRCTNREKVEDLPRLVNTDGLLPEEQVYIQKYIEFIKFKNPSFSQSISTKEILYVFYKEILGEVTSAVMDKIKEWEEELPKSIILEAFIRSIDKNNPLAYINSIINNWTKKGVKNLRDVSRLDKEFNRMKNKENDL